MTHINEQENFRLGEIIVSPQHNKLALKERSLTLQPKVMAVLCYLARHQDRVVSNEELLDQVWQGRVVTHASVQKSINALRNAFAELAGEREFITHFSKRGYQLIVPVVAAEDSGDNGAPPPDATRQMVFPSRPSAMRVLLVCGVLAMLGLGVVVLAWLNSISDVSHAPPFMEAIEVDTAAVEKRHATQFPIITDFIHENGHERSAEPHPDGKRVAYIRDTNSDGAQSQIMIRDDAGRDWLLASVDGSWADLAWSPSGRNLVATEIRRAEGLPWSPAYYEHPNYLYSFHIFTLDFRGERLLEKNLLSQWQGAVASVTWWDENVIEFVASLGPNTTNERYRYVIAEQKLSLINALESGYLPLKSAIRDKVTGVVSRRRDTARVEFLDAQQRTIATWPLATGNVDISWIPDGSGLLIFENDSRNFYVLYLDGEIAPVQFAQDKTTSFARPRFRNSGNSILLTSVATSTHVQWIGLDGNRKTIKDRNNIVAARFSPTGDALAFTSSEDGRYALWVTHNGGPISAVHNTDSVVTLDKPITEIHWYADGKGLVFRSGNSVYTYQPGSGSPKVLTDVEGLSLLDYEAGTKHLWLIKRGNNIRNIWRYHIESRSATQSTFGSVGTALAHGEKIYFQYTGQRGLWMLNDEGQNPQRISANLPENSQLLRVPEEGAYFISGGPCRESEIRYLDFKTDTWTTVLTRSDNAVITHDFHPTKGALQVECALPESNIMELKAADLQD